MFESDWVEQIYNYWMIEQTGEHSWGNILF